MSLAGIMTLLYICILCTAACVGFISAVPQVTVSALVGSTAILPCKLTDISTKTSHVRWRVNDEIVFERSSDGTSAGEGYEGRVDVPEDELHKGNCSLVLKNVTVLDDGSYRTFVVKHLDKTNTDKIQEINRVKLSVDEANLKTVRITDQLAQSPDEAGSSCPHMILIISLLVCLFLSH